MRKAKSRPGSSWNIFFFLIALLVIAADQLTKFWIRSNLSLGETLFEAGPFRVVRVLNTGAAFGIFQGHQLPLIIVSIAGITAIVAFAIYVRRHYDFLDNKPGIIALGLFLGGTIGNLIDRMAFGYVTDFVELGIWPSFNVADSAITVGIILLIWSLLFSDGALLRSERH